MERKSRTMTGLVLAVIFCIFMLSATVLAADNNGAADALPAADSAGVITLTSDVTIDSGFPTSGTIDLNGYTLTYTGNTSITVGASDTLTITDSSSDGNGNLVLSPGITSTSCYIEAKGSLILQNITITSTGSVVLPKGDGTDGSPCKVLIESCNITTTGAYCVMTNATDDGNGNSLYSGVDITIKGSVITADAGDGDDCAVMMNVEGSLTIENSTITGNRQAVVVRAGTAAITDSTIIVTGEHSQAAWTDSEKWGTGNEVPSAALLVGNLGTSSGAYYGDADVTVTDTTITSGNTANAAAVYVDSNAVYSADVSLAGNTTMVTGTVTTGYYNRNLNAGETETSTISVSEGTYSADVSAYLADDVAAGVTTDGSTTSYYTSLAAAIANAGGGTVTLYDDVTVDSALTISESLTLDLNGHELTILDAATMTVDVGVSVTITDSTTNGSVSNDGTIINNGSIIIDITLDTQDGEVRDSGTVTIDSGGELVGKLTSTVITEPAAKTGLTYDGTAQTLVSAGEANGGMMYYSLTNNGSDWSADIPAKTDAGTYTVYYKVAGDSSHNDYTPISNSVSVTIEKAEQSISYSEGSVSAHINDAAFINALTKATVGGEITYISDKTEVVTVDENTGEVAIVGAGTASVTATAAETNNYNEATASYTLTVTDHNYTSEVVAPTYTGRGYTLHTCTICNDSYMTDYTAIKVIDGTDENLSTKTTIQELTAVPEGLKNLYSGVDALIADLIGRVTVSAGYTEDNVLVYDVVLQYQINGGTWIDATVDNFPATGITVTLPYPDGTDSTYEFTVMHMFTETSTRLSITAGKTESPAVTKTDDGLVVTLTGLSPVALSWKEGTASAESTTEEDTTENETSGTSLQTNAADTTATSVSSTTGAPTGDNNYAVLWLILLFVSGVGVFGAAACYTEKKRGK